MSSFFHPARVAAEPHGAGDGAWVWLLAELWAAFHRRHSPKPPSSAPARRVPGFKLMGLARMCPRAHSEPGEATGQPLGLEARPPRETTSGVQLCPPQGAVAAVVVFQEAPEMLPPPIPPSWGQPAHCPHCWSSSAVCPASPARCGHLAGLWHRAAAWDGMQVLVGRERFSPRGWMQGGPALKSVPNCKC